MIEMTREHLAEQITLVLKSQWSLMVDSGDETGYVLHPESGLPDATHTCSCPMVAGAGLAYLLHPDATREADLRKATKIIQRYPDLIGAEGLVDFVDHNVASSPDTAFVVQQLGTMLLAGRTAAPEGEVWAHFVQSVETFLLMTVEGLKTGGFHTPNHRWVITSALCLIQVLFDRNDVEDTINAYMAEGPDINADGFYLELSAGGYDAVSNVGFLMIDYLKGWAVGREAVKKNLEMNLYLLHSDLTVESTQSTRWDNVMRRVNTGQASCYLQYGLMYSESSMINVGLQLLSSSETHWPLSTYLRLASLMMMHDQCELKPAEDSIIPQQYQRWFESIGLGRLRQNDLSLSVFRNRRNLMTAYFGQTGFYQLSVRLAYFGEAGDFVAHRVKQEKDGFTLICDGDQLSEQMPAYFQPIGKPVPFEDYESQLCERSVRQMLPMDAQLRVWVEHNTLHFHLVINPKLASGVKAQVLIDFPAGMTVNGSPMTQGQRVAMDAGSQVFSDGITDLQLSVPEKQHSLDNLSATLPVGRGFGVSMNLITPVDARWTLSGL